MKSTLGHVDGMDWGLRGVYGSGLIVFEKWGALESLSNGESIVFENTCQHVFLCRTCWKDLYSCDVHPEIKLANPYGIFSEVYMADAFT